MRITTAGEMRNIDRVTSERFGVPSLTLMENAGSAVAKVAAELWPQARRVLVVCGKGNNGGDGFVAARKLRDTGREVQVLLLADVADLRGDAAAMFERMRMPVEPVRTSEELRRIDEGAFRQADLVIDAILGTGVRPPVTGLYAEAISAMNASGSPVLAVDIPSGADSDAFAPDTANLRARADAIVTFTAPRPAHIFGQLTSGPILVAPIGSPEKAIVSELNLEVITARDIAPLLAPRAVDANKGRFGHVLTFGGSVGKSGAAAMAGMAALRVGAGLSTVATAKSALPMVASFAPELMTEALPETEAGTLECMDVSALLEGKSVVAVGPGISRNPETAAFVRGLVRDSKQATVVDADGLNAFEGAAELLRAGASAERLLVLTPHPGEMARLTGLTVPQIQRDRLGVARNFARDHQLVLVLKGHRTVVALPDGTAWINPTGNPGMAKGGSGDVLTGMVAGFLSQFGKDAPRAVCAAVYLHGLAGDIAREQVGELSMTATDLLNAVPEAVRRARAWASEAMVRVG